MSYDIRLCVKVDGTDLFADIAEPELASPTFNLREWILKPNIYGVVYCSECDYELHTNNTNFCPNCGAEMTQAGTESDGTVD